MVIRMDEFKNLLIGVCATLEEFLDFLLELWGFDRFSKKL